MHPDARKIVTKVSNQNFNRNEFRQGFILLPTSSAGIHSCAQTFTNCLKEEAPNKLGDILFGAASIFCFIKDFRAVNTPTRFLPIRKVPSRHKSAIFPLSFKKSCNRLALKGRNWRKRIITLPEYFLKALFPNFFCFSIVHRNHCGDSHPAGGSMAMSRPSFSLGWFE